MLHPCIGQVWCLHRVVEVRSKYPSNRELEITPYYLENEIVRQKEQGYRFVSIDDLLSSKCTVFPKKWINISFDDGFRDIYHRAFPIFKKYGIPFTLYLTTSFPEGKADIWWIQMENGRSIDDFERILKIVYESGKPMADEMHRLTQTTPNESLCLDLALNWDEISEMVDSGLCTVGSHTVSHPGLVRISEDSCISELYESKRIIEDKLGVEVAHFSYPHSMQNERVQRMVFEAGYKSATLGYGGIVRKGDNRYCLNRKYIVQS